MILREQFYTCFAMMLLLDKLQEVVVMSFHEVIQNINRVSWKHFCQIAI